MKVFTYNIAVAKRNRPKFSSPLARILYNDEQGKDQAFLLSEKGRLYVVRGEGVVDFPAGQIEQSAFEKYAPLRNMKLYMVTRIRRIKRKRAGCELRIVCDFYDYHQKVFVRNQSLRVARVYKNVNALWSALTKDFVEVNESKLQVNRKNQELADEREFGKLTGAVSTAIVMSILSFVMSLFVMRLFFFFGLLFAVRGIMAFSRIVRSTFSTRKRDAYCCVLCIILAIVHLVGIVLTPILAQ